MQVFHTAKCPYCGETWNIDVGPDQLSDEQFLEVTRWPYLQVMCEACKAYQFD